MFLYRGPRSVLGSSWSYYNFAGSVQAATNKPQDIYVSHTSSGISCSQVANTGALLRQLQDKPVKADRCQYIAHASTACILISRLGFSLPLSWRSTYHNAIHRFSSGTGTCIIRSYTIRPPYSALSRASTQKPSSWMNTEPVTQVSKVLLSKSAQGGDEKPEPEEKRNKTKELKKVFKEYGAVGVSFHIGISLISLGIFYIAVSSGINMTAVLCKLGFSESFVQSKMAAGTSTFVLAYAVHKLFAPFRISITLVSVPLIVRYLRKTGLLRSSPPRL